MKININNSEALDIALLQVEGQAHLAHTHSVAQIQRTAEALFTKLKRNLPAKLLVGATLKLSSQPQLPRAYGSRLVIHTEVTVEVCASGLFVVDITRQKAWATNTPAPEAVAILPESVKNHLKNVLYLKGVRL